MTHADITWWLVDSGRETITRFEAAFVVATMEDETPNDDWLCGLDGSYSWLISGDAACNPDVILPAWWGVDAAEVDSWYDECVEPRYREVLILSREDAVKIVAEAREELDRSEAEDAERNADHAAFVAWCHENDYRPDSRIARELYDGDIESEAAEAIMEYTRTRHEDTDYEQHLRDGIDRDIARDMIREQM